MASEAAGLLLDTHIWLRYLGISGDLRKAAVPVIREASNAGHLFVSVISIWEVAMLVRQGRLVLSSGTDLWVRDALSKPGIHMLPLSPEIAIESVNLPEPMHKDPADRILVASSRVERLTLVTRDQKILDFAKETRLPYLRA